MKIDSHSIIHPKVDFRVDLCEGRPMESRIAMGYVCWGFESLPSLLGEYAKRKRRPKAVFGGLNPSSSTLGHVVQLEHQPSKVGGWWFKSIHAHFIMWGREDGLSRLAHNQEDALKWFDSRPHYLSILFVETQFLTGRITGVGRDSM
jgi:hypothetical protein